jgi:hypothetical protein
LESGISLTLRSTVSRHHIAEIVVVFVRMK